MSRHKLAPFLAALAFAVSPLAGKARADDTPVQPRKLAAAIRNGEIIGREQVRRVFVTCETNEFLFVAPHGLRVDADPAMVSVVSPDATFFLTVRILGVAAPSPNAESPDFHRNLVLNRFPGAKVLEEYSKSAAGREALTFDLRVEIARQVERAVCVALVSSASGILEFTLNADPAKLEEARKAFNTVLRTFSNKADGELEMVTCETGQS